MSCEHCCYACTANGKDMSIKIFKKALEIDDMPSIGGGEPTIHPKFWEFMGLAIGKCEYVWLATNGKKTQIALTLAKMAKRGIIGCALSQDNYHDPIDPVVVRAFENKARMGDTDQREIRNMNGKELNAGRCDFGKDGCVCSDLICKPNGDVFACGCEGAPKFGNVNTGFEIPDNWEHGECYGFQENDMLVRN